MHPLLVATIVEHCTPIETRFLTACAHHDSIDFNATDLPQVKLTANVCKYCIQSKISPYMILTALIRAKECAVLCNSSSDDYFHAIVSSSNSSSLKRSLLRLVIELQRPVCILAHVIQQLRITPVSKEARNLCDIAAGAGNITALQWLRDTSTGNGRYGWTQWTCLAAVTNGRLKMLQRLRDPAMDGGVCVWDQAWCLEVARIYRRPAIARWIETQLP